MDSTGICVHPCHMQGEAGEMRYDYAYGCASGTREYLFTT